MTYLIALSTRNLNVLVTWPDLAWTILNFLSDAINSMYSVVFDSKISETLVWNSSEILVTYWMASSTRIGLKNWICWKSRCTRDYFEISNQCTLLFSVGCMLKQTFGTQKTTKLVYLHAFSLAQASHSKRISSNSMFAAAKESRTISPLPRPGK